MTGDHAPLCPPTVWVVLTAALMVLTACTPRGLEQAPTRPDQPWPIPASATATQSTAAGAAHPLESNAAHSPAPTPAAGPTADLTAATSVGNDAHAAAFDPERRYDLPALIDLAQRNNPQTREAWEAARAAALASGLVETTYLPQIAVEALAGRQRTPYPLPSDLAPDGYFTATSREFVPALTLEWLLFDFGRREQLRTATRETAFAARLNFTGVHQKLVYEVSRGYYGWAAAEGRAGAADRALETAAVDLDAVQARRTQGLATVVDVAQSQRQHAQRRFEQVRAQSAQRQALASLNATLGLIPPASVRLAPPALEQEAFTAPAIPLPQVLDQALARRPDLLAAAARLRAAQAGVQRQKAEYRPTIGLLAQAYRNIGEVEAGGGAGPESINAPGDAVFLRFSVPLFDGGQRATRVALAESEAGAAEAQLHHARDEAARQVVEAYLQLESSLAEREATVTLVAAATQAHDAALESYRQGLGTATTLVDSENALVQAQTAHEDALAAVRIASAALAFAAGTMGEADTAR